MSRLVESLKIDNGVPAHLEYHNARLNRSRRELFGATDDIDIADVLRGHAVPDAPVCKCRVLYRDLVEAVEIAPYQCRSIVTLRLVVCDEIDYNFKYEDKSAFEALLKKRDRCDDILIVKNGLITDTSFSNIAFFDGVDWFTPARPLLKGTARERLITKGVLREDDIAPSGLLRFRKASFINAMLDLGELETETGSIYP